MSKRMINAQLLRSVVQSKFDGDLNRFAKASKVSKSWLEKAISGNYTREPKALTMSAIAAAAKSSEDELFPLVGAKGKRTAS